MTRHTWKRRIKSACKAAGTYQPYFDNVIDTLAGILERRDDARDAFEETGKQLTIIHTNKAGQENEMKNPALQILNEANRDALAYWKELGLTPAGLKKLRENALREERKESAFEAALQKLGGS